MTQGSSRTLREYEMVAGTSPEEAALMKQQARVEEAQTIRRLRRKADEQAAP